MMQKHMLILGCGFSGQAIRKAALAQGIGVTATKQNPILPDYQPLHLDENHKKDEAFMRNLLRNQDILVMSIAPEKGGDMLLNLYQDCLLEWLEQKNRLIFYLSTTGVYGNHDGAWVDESSPTTPTMHRTRQRLAAEQAWQALLHQQKGNFLYILRLGGIYGMGRNAIENMIKGRTRRIYKQGQYFSRIHVEDIANALLTMMAKPSPQGAWLNIYNLVDDEPSPPQSVMDYAASLLQMELPPMLDFDKAELSSMQRSFYMDNKRVSNQKIKRDFDYEFLYPHYRVALDEIHKHLKP